MFKHNKHPLMIIVFLALIMIYSPSGVEAGGKPLFADAPEHRVQSSMLPQNTSVIHPARSRVAHMNRDLLESMEPEIHLNLLEGTSLDAMSERLERRSSSRYTWFGRVGETGRDYAVIVIENEKIAGNVRHNGKLYQLSTDASGATVISEVDRSTLTDEAEPIPVISEDEVQEDGFEADAAQVIDVMILYTPAVANALDNIDATIQLVVDETNLTYANSGISQRVRLVYSAMVSYNESGDMSADLSRLRSTSDGYMDEIHRLRDAYGADLVSLWTEEGGYCGIGYVMTNVSSSFASSGFCVVRRPCATGSYSQAHEWGHNMGAKHDSYVSPEPGAYEYSHGYVSTQGQWRTVMAYADRCTDLGISCARIPQWSNPDVSYGGRPTGIAQNQPNAADNRMTLNQTAAAVASFRPSTTPSAPAASFVTNASSGAAPLEVRFTNTSSGTYNSFEWNFGDGQTENRNPNPSHTYGTPGTYAVTFTVAGPGGTDEAHATVSVTAKSTPQPVPQPAPQPVPLPAPQPNSKPMVSVIADNPKAIERNGKKAVFTISRTGETASPLVVRYRLGGTATNGVDYKRLWGFVRIPAGQSSVRVRIAPRYNKKIEGAETVVLRLLSRPVYRLKFPRQANAVIKE